MRILALSQRNGMSAVPLVCEVFVLDMVNRWLVNAPQALQPQRGKQPEARAPRMDVCAAVTGA
jgi:hypothetical protein